MTIDKTVAKETRYIAAWVLIFSALLQVVFAVIGKWDYTVLLGNLLGGGVAVGNFLLMGLTVQKAVTEEQSPAARRIRMSQSYRLLLQGVALIIAAVVPWFSLWAAAVPLLFPRFAVMMRPWFNKKDGGEAP